MDMKLKQFFSTYKKYVVIVVTAVILIVSFFTWYFSVGRYTPKKIFNDSLNCVVEIKAYSITMGDAYGTGVFIDNQGNIVTNAHVVTYTLLDKTSTFGEYGVRFAFEEDYRAAELVKYDLEKDIAVLTLKNNKVKYKPVKIGDSDKVSFGDKVYAVGNALNYGLSLTQGMISMPRVYVEYDGRKREVIQSDLTISAGNSGGALFDKRGRLIGITTFRTKDQAGVTVQGLAYSIPVNTVMEFLN